MRALISTQPRAASTEAALVAADTSDRAGLGAMEGAVEGCAVGAVGKAVGAAVLGAAVVGAVGAVGVAVGAADVGAADAVGGAEGAVGAVGGAVGAAVVGAVVVGAVGAVGAPVGARVLHTVVPSVVLIGVDVHGDSAQPGKRGRPQYSQNWLQANTARVFQPDKSCTKFVAP